MKIATGNRLNEFWEELNGVLIPKSKVLKTIEEIEANTNEENIAGATALKEVNNKLANGRVEIVVTDDNRLGYRLDGADTVYPFSSAYKINCTVNIIVKNTYSSATINRKSNGYIVIYGKQSKISGMDILAMSQNLHDTNDVTSSCSISISSIEVVDPSDYF